MESTEAGVDNCLLWLTIAAAVVISLVGVGIMPLARAIPSSLVQVGDKSQLNRVLSVALPDSATVWLAQGGSRNGELTEFNTNSLTLVTGGNQETFDLTEVTSVEFGSAVWIPTPDGELRLRRIRGISQSVEGLPTAALDWDGPPNLADLDLQEGMTQGEFNKLTRDPDLVFALTRVQFEGTDRTTMNVRVKSLLK